MTDHCLFCQNHEAKVTVEHTLSQPIRDLMPERGKFTFEYLSVENGVMTTRPPRESDMASYTRRAYCQPCNGDWMGPMDVAIAKVIAPLVAGYLTTLGPLQQRAIATWVTKLALVYESLSGARTVIPAERYRWFFENRQPFPNMPVQLAHWIGGERHAYVRRVLNRLEYPSQRVLGVEGVVMTLVIDEYVAQTFLPADPTRMAVPRDGSDRITIWPPTIGNVVWPPIGKVDASSLLAFSDIET